MLNQFERREYHRIKSCISANQNWYWDVSTKCAWLCLTTPLLNFWTSKAVAKALPELLESLHLSLLLTGSVTASLLTPPPRSCTAQDCNDDSSKRFKAHPFHALVFFLTAVLKARDDLCNSIHWNLARALESGCFAFCFHAPAIHWPSIKQDTANHMWFTWNILKPHHFTPMMLRNGSCRLWWLGLCFKPLPQGFQFPKAIRGEAGFRKRLKGALLETNA